MAHVLQQSNRAAAAVFDITELFEHILLETTISDLFVHQRVSKKWFAFIKTSKKLQKKMFLLADGEPVSPIAQRSDTAYTCYAAQVLAVNPSCLHRYESGHWSLPIQSPYIGGVDLSDQWSPEVSSVGLDIHDGDRVHDLERSARGRNNIGASWRRMLLTQPPITALDLQQRPLNPWREDTQVRGCVTRLGGWSDVVTVWNAEGVTLGDVFKSTTESVLGVIGDGINNRLICNLNICKGDGVFAGQKRVGKWA